jgi:hypothetical protein
MQAGSLLFSGLGRVGLFVVNAGHSRSKRTASLPLAYDPAIHPLRKTHFMKCDGCADQVRA